jgi:Domain of unknown function (DUF4249)
MILNKSIYLSFPLVCFFFLSCQKEVNINLNASNPRYVIEADLSDAVGDSKVTLTKTLNFDATTANPAVSGAIVSIKDNTTNTIDTLKESSRLGVYTKMGLVGFFNHSYTLTVNVDGKVFVSKPQEMPDRVDLDSLAQIITTESNFGGGRPNGPNTRPKIEVKPYFTDPLFENNIYQIIIARNDTLQKNLTLRNDANFSGIFTFGPMRIDAAPNDSVQIDLQCINLQVYDYLRDLRSNVAQNIATPANPTSNINNGALGYFKVHTSSKKSIVIK